MAISFLSSTRLILGVDYTQTFLQLKRLLPSRGSVFVMMKSFVWRTKEIIIGSCRIGTRTYLIQGRVDYLTATFGTIQKHFVFYFVLAFLSNYI